MLQMNLFFLLPTTKFQIKAQNCAPKDIQTTELETWGMVPKASPDSQEPKARRSPLDQAGTRQLIGTGTLGLSHHT